MHLKTALDNHAVLVSMDKEDFIDKVNTKKPNIEACHVPEFPFRHDDGRPSQESRNLRIRPHKAICFQDTAFYVPSCCLDYGLEAHRDAVVLNIAARCGGYAVMTLAWPMLLCGMEAGGTSAGFDVLFS